MEAGYFSKEAVKDILAVREGELIYLRNRVTILESENIILHNRIKDLKQNIDKSGSTS